MRAWSDAPDPGDDFNCRCWAEPVELTEDVKQALKVAYKHLNDFKEDKYTLSVKFLEHYLGNTGSKVILPEDIFDRNPVVQSAIKKNQERFQGQLESIAYKFSPSTTFKDYWDVDINKENFLESLDEDFARAIGSVKIRSEGSFNIQKKGNLITVHGRVVIQFRDVYDFNDDSIIDYVLFKNERLLTQKGYAKPFEIEWKKEQTVEGEIVFKNGILESKKFIWGK
jgi:hypothetical protein